MVAERGMADFPERIVSASQMIDSFMTFLKFTFRGHKYQYQSVSGYLAPREVRFVNRGKGHCIKSTNKSRFGEWMNKGGEEVQENKESLRTSRTGMNNEYADLN
jgi:hypothetical protein